MMAGHRIDKWLVSSLMIAGLVLSSCGQAATPPATAASGPTVPAPATVVPTKAAASATVLPVVTAPAAAAPTVAPAWNPTGELKFGVPSLRLVQFDPKMGGAWEAQLYSGAVFDALVGIDSKGGPAPGIAEKWEFSPDGKTWTFYIRKGVKFHDGSDLTAADVKFSLDRAVEPDSTMTDAATFRAVISSIEMKDDYTVVFRLKQPTGELWKGMIASTGNGSLILPKKYIEAKGVDYFRANPIGSGPWKVVKQEFGNVIQFEAVGNWRAKPEFKTVKLMAVPEQGTRIAMLKTGELDIAEIGSDAVQQVKDNGLRVFSYDSGNMAGMGFYYDLQNPSKNPIADVRVRKALSLAINRQELSSKLFGGYAKPLAVFGVPTNIYFYDANVLKVDPFDPTQAKKLLADAGYPNGFTMKLYSSPLTAWMPVLNEAISGYWTSIGVKVQLTALDWSVLRGYFTPKQLPEVWGNANLWQFSGVPGFYLTTPFHSKKGFHQNHNNAKLDQLIEQTEGALDPVEKKKLALQAAVEAQNENSIIGVLSFDAIYGVGKAVGDWTPIQGQVAPALTFETVTRAK